MYVCTVYRSEHVSQLFVPPMRAKWCALCNFPQITNDNDHYFILHFFKKAIKLFGAMLGDFIFQYTRNVNRQKFFWQSAVIELCMC